jgi:hypothetical protein
LEIVRNMELYNPDKTWRRTAERWLESAMRTASYADSQ